MGEENFQTLSQMAREAIGQRDWDRAKQEYLRALGLKSDVPDVHYGLATVYFQLNELTSAAHHFKEVTRLEPKRAGAYVNLGAVLNLLTNYDESITALRKGIQLDPKRTEGYYNLGLVYRRKGQLDMAIQAYREAIRLNPHLSDAHFNLANIYFDKQQFRQAITHYEHALQSRPDWPKALDGLERARAALTGAQTPAVLNAQPTEEDTRERHVDPNVHGDFLDSLHRVSVESEEIGRHLQTVLIADLEMTIKELSLSLLNTQSTGSELAEHVDNFESSKKLLQESQANLRESLAKLQKLESQFAELPPGTLPEVDED